MSLDIRYDIVENEWMFLMTIINHLSLNFQNDYCTPPLTCPHPHTHYIIVQVVQWGPCWALIDYSQSIFRETHESFYFL